MPPSLPITITDWARLPLDRLLAANTGECLPEGAVQAAHELHKQAVATVPAYRAFCSSAHRRGSGAAGSQPDCTAADAEQPSAPCYSWQDVPFTSKQSYFHRWPLPQRCTGGTIGAADFVHCSSGSSGQPTLWARNAFDELAVCARCVWMQEPCLGKGCGRQAALLQAGRVLPWPHQSRRPIASPQV